MEALLFVGVIAAITWFFVFRSRHPSAGDQRLSPDGPTQLVVEPPSLFLAGDGAYSYSVVGESHYQPALRLIAGVEGAEGKRHECDAVLLHQPANVYDKSACAVTIGGNLVGHLPKKEAKEFVAIMKSKGLSDGFSVACKAVITGGWIAKDGFKGSYGVSLDIDTSEFPATSIQKEMLRYLGQKPPKVLSRKLAEALRVQASVEFESRYAQWLVLEQIIEHLHSEDGREEFFEIRKPSIKAIREAFEHFLNEGKSPEEICDELDELVEYMIDQNPSLEK